jgi:SAM-dependent methyltransferase
MDVQAKINALWDRASAEYDATPTHGIDDAEQSAAWSAVFAALLPPPPADVLDVGTGTGVIALLLARDGYAVRGVDLSEGMLGHARGKAQTLQLAAHFEIADAHDPPGDQESVDAIVSRHVFWTLMQPARALTNWLRLLRPGARLVIVDGLWGGKADDRIDDIAPSLPLLAPATSQDDIRRLVEATGYVDVTLSALPELDRLEQSISGERDPQPHYVLAARKPVSAGMP